MHPLFKCRVAKLADYPESPQFDVAGRSQAPLPLIR